MRSLIVASLLLACTSNAALPEIQISKHQSGASHLAVRKAWQIARRDGTVDIGTAEALGLAAGGGYFTTLMVGTPPQELEIVVGTASSDTYFLTSNACQGPATDPNACRGTVFDPDSSTSYNITRPSPAFNTSVYEGTNAYGPYASDTFTFGDVAIEDVEFGVADSANTTIGYTTGYLGLGYTTGDAGTSVFPGLPDFLQASGVINSRLFAIYLNELSTSGSILFGGIDSSKYSDELVTLDLIPNGDQITSFTINMTALSVSTDSSGPQQTIFSGNEQNGSASPVDLCIGCGGVLLPMPYYQQLMNTVFSFVDSQGLCSCSYRDDGRVLQFAFGLDLTIIVPMRDLIVPLLNTTDSIDGTPQTYPNGSSACYAAINSGDDGSNYFSLGEPVLRSMYLVFDLDNAQVSIAQAIINSTAQPEVQTVAAGLGGVQHAASRVISAASNTYSIAPTVAINDSLSTYSVSVASTSASGSSTSVVTQGVSTTGTSSVPPTSSPSKSAGISDLWQKDSRDYLWLFISVAFTMAFSAGAVISIADIV